MLDVVKLFEARPPPAELGTSLGDVAGRRSAWLRKFACRRLPKYEVLALLMPYCGSVGDRTRRALLSSTSFTELWKVEADVLCGLSDMLAFRIMLPSGWRGSEETVDVSKDLHVQRFVYGRGPTLQEQLDLLRDDEEQAKQLAELVKREGQQCHEHRSESLST
ncbi:hypothetical protein BKA80DRAFT_254857 [Phyllosticta citrichinensis]